MTRGDRTIGGLVVALLALGLLVRPVALGVDVKLRVADACFPWPVPEAMHGGIFIPDQRTWAFLFRTPPPDPWGRPWALRDPTTADAASAVPLAFDPADPMAGMLKGKRTRVVYSLGPDGVDDGGSYERDVVVERRALQRLLATDGAAEVGGWLAGLVLLAWTTGRRAARRRRWLFALVPLVLGATIGALRALGRVQYTGLVPDTLPDLPLVIPLEAAVVLSLLAILGLVAGLGWSSTRAQAAQCEGDGSGAGDAGAPPLGRTAK